MFNPVGQKRIVEQRRPRFATLASWQTSFGFRANIVQRSSFRNHQSNEIRFAMSKRRHRPGIATSFFPSWVMDSHQRLCALSNSIRSCLGGFVLTNNRIPAIRQSFQIVFRQWLAKAPVNRPQLFVVTLGQIRTNVHGQWQTFDVGLDGCWFHAGGSIGDEIKL